MALERLAKKDWTPELAAHLLNRAGFGGSPSDVEALYSLGHADAVARLLQPPPSVGLPDPAWANPFSARRDEGMDGPSMRMLDPEVREARQRVLRKLEQARLFDLRAWWLHRMRYATHPLQEKMTLFLHGHFATSYEKVRNAYAMFLQNQTFRRHATGNWRELVEAVTRDPAMLIYLDGIQNTKESPNENYAREVMELFTLGEGHYTEEDIRDAARAFTGWKFDRRGFAMTFEERRHDPGRKSFMGRKGNFTAEDIIGIILEQPQAARWIAEKLWTFFAYENPEPSVIDALAKTLRSQKYELLPMIEEMLMSRAFYGGRAFRRQVKSPVQWLVSTCRYLDIALPEPSQIQPLLVTLGQNLFEPPNVKGWDGGVTWITTASLGQRYEATSRLATGRSGSRQRNRMLNQRDELQREAAVAGVKIDLPDENTEWLKEVPDPLFDWTALLPEEMRTSRSDVMEGLMWRLYQSALRDRDRAMLEQYFADLPPVTRWNKDTFARALEALMNNPQFQLT